MNNEYYLTKDTSGGSIKDIDVKQGIITGYFAIFNNIDADNDIIMPGAAKKTIEENGPESKRPRIMHLLQHDIWRPLSKPSVLKEDNKGIYFESKISDTSYGRDVIQLYQDGVYTEHSIGFQLMKHDIDTEKGIRKIKEIKLWEGSTVTWGANAEALVSSVKGQKTKDITEKIIKKIDAINSALKGNYTDETLRMLEIELKQLQQIIITLVEKLEPDNTQVKNKPEEMSAKEAYEILLNKLKI
ncbi:MAG TPA: HK97 family phage prohead protease [Sedimentibacter sp.]|nr:HK97 family phage prohead protease [Sedimentibacter sp.]